MNNRGFTLLEILVALSVFAIVATLTASLLQNAFTTRKRLEEQAARTESLQLATILIRRDILQLVLRPVRGDEMHQFPPLTGLTRYVELTRSGFVNPGEVEKRATLQRVAWVCQGDKLIRRTWQVLDPPNRRHVHQRVLLDQLDACFFAYLDKNRQFLPEWRRNIPVSGPSRDSLPLAFQIHLTQRGQGPLSLLFVIPEGLHDET